MSFSKGLFTALWKEYLDFNWYVQTVTLTMTLENVSHTQSQRKLWRQRWRWVWIGPYKELYEEQVTWEGIIPVEGKGWSED